MKIRSQIELDDALSNDLSWRKKEITTLHLLIQNKREHEKKLLTRSAIVILYAHWEGFVKNASRYYLEYVSRKKLPYKDLNTNFISIVCRAVLKEAASSNKIRSSMQLVDFIRFNQEDSSRIPYDGVIDTGDNLNSEYFKNILSVIGLTYKDVYLTKELLVDGSLLRLRNSIAHGEKLEVSESEYLVLHDLVRNHLEYFRIDIINSAQTESYKKITTLFVN